MKEREIERQRVKEREGDMRGKKSREGKGDKRKFNRR
jgi:hypothetical protein